MEQTQNPLNNRILKYLQIGKNSLELEKVWGLWCEAQKLLDIHTAKMQLSKEAFMNSFQPYAEESEVIQKLLKDAKIIWLMGVSIGEALELRSKVYFSQNEVFNGYILDRIGSFFVEEEMKKVDKAIRIESEKKGCLTTMRYSPGYKDFSIKAQQIFFKLIRPHIHGLELTSAYLIKPEKTITAIKGIIPT